MVVFSVYCCIKILLRVLVTKTGFGLVIGFIDHSQAITTINYNIVHDLQNLQSLHYNLLILFPLVFAIHFLATVLSTQTIRVLLNHTLQMLLHYSTHKVFTSHLKSSIHKIRSSPTTNLPQLSATVN
jgi:hypothetical protein